MVFYVHNYRYEPTILAPPQNRVYILYIYIYEAGNISPSTLLSFISLSLSLSFCVAFVSFTDILLPLLQQQYSFVQLNSKIFLFFLCFSIHLLDMSHSPISFSHACHLYGGFGSRCHWKNLTHKLTITKNCDTSYMGWAPPTRAVKERAVEINQPRVVKYKQESLLNSSI
jgi:hypothetical protein